MRGWLISWRCGAFGERFRHGLVLSYSGGFFEIIWAIGLKFTVGFTRLWPSIGTAAALIFSLGLLGLAARDLPIGTAYAIWTGLGAAGTVLVGIWLLGEPAHWPRLVCVGLILAGVIGLKITSP
jgi:quaternary ammonium compound-resistance protein SugE